MNDAQAIEIALAETMRAHAAIGAGVALRPWQSLRAYATCKSIVRVFPCLDIRCTPPALDESQATHNCTASIMAGTLADADADHAIVSALYDAAQGTCERLFAQQRGAGGVHRMSRQGNTRTMLLPVAYARSDCQGRKATPAPIAACARMVSASAISMACASFILRTCSRTLSR